MSELPTVVEELNRKTIEAMERLQWKFDTKQISGVELASALDALWDAGSGLIDKDIAALIAQMRDQIIDQTVERRLFIDSHGTPIMLELPYGGDSVTLHKEITGNGWGSTQQLSGASAADPKAKARQILEQMTVALHNNGYKELR